MDVLARNNVRVVGSGSPTIMLAHGFGCDQTMWQRFTRSFIAHHTCVLFDLVGGGQSDLESYDFEKYSTLDGYASDILEILERISAGPVIFIGHSVSAMIGMLAAIKAPERFAANIMIAPSPSFINDDQYVGGFDRSDIEELLETLQNNFLGWSSSIAPVIVGAPDQPEIATDFANSFCRTSPDIAKHFAGVTFLADCRSELHRVTTPTLIIQANDDLLAPRAVGEYMHKMIPNSRLAVVDNVGHCPHITAVSASAEATKTFLASLGL